MKFKCYARRYLSDYRPFLKHFGQPSVILFGGIAVRLDSSKVCQIISYSFDKGTKEKMYNSVKIIS